MNDFHVTCPSAISSAMTSLPSFSGAFAGGSSSSACPISVASLSNSASTLRDGLRFNAVGISVPCDLTLPSEPTETIKSATGLASAMLCVCSIFVQFVV